MLPAPSLADIDAHSSNRPGVLCCVLFAPLFSKTAKEGVIPRIAYLNHRSGDDIDFYCAGYGGYWHTSDVPDMEVIGDVRYDDGTVIPWAFSQQKYASFIDELEAVSTWNYSGETELLVFDVQASYQDCLVLEIDRMVQDNAISRASDLFESLIQYARHARGRASAYKYSDSKAPGIFAKTVLNVISEGPKGMGKAWKAGRHYATRNIKK